MSLSGMAEVPAPRVCLSTSVLDFGSVAEGDTASPLSVTVSNCGTAALVISEVSIGGPNADDFTKSMDTCMTVPVGQSCMIGVTFKPGGRGQRIAQLNIASNATGSPHVVDLTGVGTGTQPDAWIAPAVSGAQFKGKDQFDPPTEQVLALRVGRGRSVNVLVRVQNDGNAPDKFTVSGSANHSGITARYFLSNPSLLEITPAVVAGQYVTGMLAPGAYTGSATQIYLRLTVSRTAPTGTYDFPVTFRSVASPTKVDTVKVRLKVL
ncbi:MAG: choice-of-anchor D domain-containing protein [Verrucomicrobiae bacterium]|nr:choice-of-anchor D domain-containing protein [Verrucomicrobiae bacterium]